MTDWINVRAGRQAFMEIQEHGLTQQQVGMVLGASGGPKWFVLQGIDQFLISDFFKDRTAPLDLLGTSAGAWRFASYGQPDASAASQRFAELYRTQTYSAKPTVAEITREAQSLLHQYVPDSALAPMLQQSIFRHHLIAVRCKGLAAQESKLQAAGLALSALSNSMSRRLLKRRFERVIFHHPSSAVAFADTWRDFVTHKVPLTDSN